MLLMRMVMMSGVAGSRIVMCILALARSTPARGADPHAPTRAPRALRRGPQARVTRLASLESRTRTEAIDQEWSEEQARRLTSKPQTLQTDTRNSL